MVKRDTYSLSASSFKCLWKAHISNQLGVSGKTDSCFDSSSSSLLIEEIKGALNAAFVDSSLTNSLDEDATKMVAIFKCLKNKLSGMDETTSKSTITSNVEICIPSNSDNVKIQKIKAAVLNSFDLLVEENN